MTIGPEAPRHSDFWQKPAGKEHGSLSEERIRIITSCIFSFVEKVDEKVIGMTEFKGKKSILEEVKASSREHFAYRKNGNTYSVYNYPSANRQILILGSKDTKITVEFKYGAIDHLETYINSGDCEKTMSLYLGETSLLNIEQKAGGITIQPLIYDIAESGDMELLETQGIYVNAKNKKEEASSKIDDEANRLTIVCSTKSFEFPLTIKPEMLFEEFEEHFGIR